MKRLLSKLDNSSVAFSSPAVVRADGVVVLELSGGHTWEAASASG